MLKSKDFESFKAITDQDEATDWWTKNYENCADCCGEADEDHSCEQIEPRRASAKQALDDFKTFTCNGTSSSSSSSTSSNSSSSKSSSTSTSQFTLLEEYGQLTFYPPDASENGGCEGCNGTDSINNGRLADGQAARDIRDGGVLKEGDVVYIETTSDPNAEGSYANGKYFIIADSGGETVGRSSSENGTCDIDIFVDKHESELHGAPYGYFSNPKVYKVASGVTWEEYLEKYHDKTGATVSPDPCGGNTASSTGNLIADTALKLSYFVEKKGTMDPKVPKPEYLAAMQVAHTEGDWSGKGEGASCDQFVATVMISSGADPNFNLSVADCSGQYMLHHPELYEEINFNGSNFEVLRPGDIFSTFSPTNDPSDACAQNGHIYIYAEKNGQRIRADASSGGRTAEHYYTDPVDHDSTNSRSYRKYKVFRRK